MAKIGDRVRFLNSVGGGIIKRIEGNIAYVDDNGFETPTLIRECVVVASPEVTEKKVALTQDEIKPTVKPSANSKPSSTPAPSELPVEETPEGDKLNVVLAYEPNDIKHLNSSTFDTYLVNDSNYYLYFTYLSRADEANGWTTRYAGVVEPNIQVFLEEISGSDLPAMDRIAVQMIAFKSDREFKIKSPVAIETALDTTKFFKLHCFRSNPYFDKEVIAVDLVTNDVPRQRMVLDSSQLEKGIKAKKAVDRPVKRPVQKHQPKRGDRIEVDLHINELVDTTAGLSPADILNLQIDEFRKVMDANLKNKGQKIVFIHGKGEGVLRAALMKELNHRYKGHDVQDASFREFGFGATQVTI
ncbi:DUF2027 domain-containing protein [uncultured Duncaniella sp.]|uniref:DUF2027 domain-containing protein n=1 Tax=uncultured Duncaniella sp. TaxID=2768039 RepID=UPI0025E4D1D6|nr:DUF2027 domain-containing protein [uncultured Duncaniella sp.]